MAQTHKVGLIGAGAVGSLLAATLLHQRCELHWVVRSSQRRNQLEPGLVLNRLSANGSAVASYESFSTADVHFLNNVKQLPDCELLVAVKAYQLSPLVADLEDRLTGNELVVCNGLVNPPCLLGLLFGGARLDNKGQLYINARSHLFMGTLGGNQQADTAAAGWLARLVAPWLTVEFDPSIAQRMWHKLALNCIVNPLTALLGLPNGALLPLLNSPVIEGLLDELVPVLRSKQAEKLANAAVLRCNLRELLEITAKNESSMLTDLRHGRQTEIEQLNIALADHAEALGLDCELTRLLGEAVRVLSAQSARETGVVRTSA